MLQVAQFYCIAQLEHTLSNGEVDTFEADAVMRVVILTENLYVLCHLFDKGDQVCLAVFKLGDEHVKLTLYYGKKYVFPTCVIVLICYSNPITLLLDYFPYPQETAPLFALELKIKLINGLHLLLIITSSRTILSLYHQTFVLFVRLLLDQQHFLIIALVDPFHHLQTAKFIAVL